MTTIRHKDGPPQGPWWMFRGPHTDRERLELAAAGFEERPRLERYLLVKQHLPSAYSRVPTDIQAEVEGYAVKRKAQAELGLYKPTSTDPALVDELRAAAAVVEGPQPPNIATVEREWRTAFRTAVKAAVDGGDPRAPEVTFVSWLRSLGAAAAAHLPLNEACDALGLPGHPVPVFDPPRFSVEKDAAVAAAAGAKS